MPRTFYRILKSPVPTVDDFKSPAALGREPREPNPSAATLRSFQGVSVLDTPAHARAWVERFKGRLGEYVAELTIPDELLRDYKGPNAKGHVDLFGVPPEALLSCVASIVHFSEIPEADS